MNNDWLKRLINGSYASGKNIVGRCHLLAHRGYLTKSLVASHDCIAKKCPFLEKTKKEYWQRLEEAAQKKKENRLKRKEALCKLNDRNEMIRETLEDSGNIHVTSIRDDDRHSLNISYIYDKRVDLSPEIKFLRGKLGKKIRLRAVFAPDDNIEHLIRKPRRETRNVRDVRKAPLVGDATKRRLKTLGIYCLEDLYGRNAEWLYKRDCKLSNQKVNRRYLSAYRSVVAFANEM